MRNHFRGIPRKIYNFRRNRQRNLSEQICNRREQVVRAGCKLLRANYQSKYQHCGGSLQSCAEKNIRFDCKSLYSDARVNITVAHICKLPRQKTFVLTAKNYFYMVKVKRKMYFHLRKRVLLTKKVC